MDIATTSLANLIQVSVAPVFLLTGIAGFLNVMSGRLSRIVDRARVMERRVVVLKDDSRLELAQYELRNLWRRISIINRSIGMCTAAAIMVCTLVASMFMAELWKFSLANFVVTQFVLAMCLLIVALILFLKEVQLATRTLKMGTDIID